MQTARIHAMRPFKINIIEKMTLPNPEPHKTEPPDTVPGSFTLDPGTYEAHPNEDFSTTGFCSLHDSEGKHIANVLITLSQGIARLS